MIQGDRCGAETSASGTDLRLHMLANGVQYLLECIQLVDPDVYDKLTLCRHHVMLLVVCLDDGTAHFHRSQEYRYVAKLVSPEPINIPHGLVHSIITFLAGSMTSFAMRYTIQYHQSSFGYGEVHQGGLPYNGTINL